MDLIRPSSQPQQVQQDNWQRADSGRVQPSSQPESIFQLLPKDEKDRKSIIDRLICEHNAQCSKPVNKIYVTQQPFSVNYPQLGQWINATFSDISRRSMYLIAFALGGFAEYHDLATSQHGGATAKVNTQFIEDWFAGYGTEPGMQRLIELSETVGRIEKWHLFYDADIKRFCSRITPKTLMKENFESIKGIKEQSYWTANSYPAAATVFSTLCLESASLLGFNDMFAMEAFGVTYFQGVAMKEQYGRGGNPLNNAVMAAIDNYIKPNQYNPELFSLLQSCFQEWVNNGCRKDVIKCFTDALKDH